MRQTVIFPKLRSIPACVALLCSASAAQAQGVSIYGVVDTGVERVTNVGATQATVIRMPTITGSSPSRIGFRGTEDLGGGLKTNFVIESGFGPDSGVLNQGGRMFGRQAYVGLSGPWGALTLGRQYSQITFAIIGDNLGPNIYGAGLLDSYLPNSRMDNALVYKGNFGNVGVGLGYSLGRDAVGAPAAGGCAGESLDRKACRDLSGSLQYVTKDWGAAFSFDRMWGGGGVGSPLPLSSQTDTRSIASGFVKTMGASLSGTYIHRKNEGSAVPLSKLWSVGLSYPMGELVFDLQYGKIDFKNSSNDASLVAGRVLYFLSKRTSLYFTAGHVSNKGAANFTIDGGVAAGANPLPGIGQTGTMVGIRHTF
jgi:predicted porin